MKFYTIAVLLTICSMLGAQNTMHDICPLKVGAEIPEVQLMDVKGEEMSLQALTQDVPSVIVFYRGAWCGYCTKHLAEIHAILPDIDSLGYQLFAVSMDQASKLESANDKYETEVPLYSDARAEAINAFGLNWKVEDEMFAKYLNEYKIDLEAWSGESHHELPVPAVYVINDGIVSFQYVNPNYNTRLEASTLLAILETL